MGLDTFNNDKQAHLRLKSLGKESSDEEIVFENLYMIQNKLWQKEKERRMGIEARIFSMNYISFSDL